MQLQKKRNIAAKLNALNYFALVPLQGLRIAIPAAFLLSLVLSFLLCCSRRSGLMPGMLNGMAAGGAMVAAVIGRYGVINMMATRGMAISLSVCFLSNFNWIFDCPLVSHLKVVFAFIYLPNKVVTVAAELVTSTTNRWYLSTRQWNNHIEN